MFEYIVSFALGASIFFFVGAIVGEETIKTGVAGDQTQYVEQGYIKAFTDQMGYDIGVPVAKCKLSGGEPIVGGNRVACVKEMKYD